MALVIIGAALLAIALIAHRRVIFSAGFLLFAVVLWPPLFYALAVAGLAVIVLGLDKD